MSHRSYRYDEPDRPEGIIPHGRIAYCEKHRVNYNKEDGECSLCEADERTRNMPIPAAPSRRPLRMGYTGICRICKHACRKANSGVCSKYACRKAAGLVANCRKFICTKCGRRTKYRGVCSRYACARGTAARRRYYPKARIVEPWP